MSPDARLRAAQLSLGELLRRNAARLPAAPALRLEERTVTYGELDERSSTLAAVLREREVREGDTVAVLMHNGIEMVETLFAIHKLGAVAAPLNFRLSTEEVTFILADVGACGLVADEPLLELTGGAPGIDWTLAVSGEPGSSYEESLAAASRLEPEQVDDDAPAFVMYTSGTTGRPKGAVLTHKNLVVNTWSWAFEVGVARGDTYTAGFPLFHIGGLVGLYPFLLLGECVVLQRSRGFDPDAALELIAGSAATICAFVPAQWQLLVDRPGAAERLRGQRRALWGGSPASRPLLERMVETLPADSVISTFGQTEVTANATFLGPADALRKLGSVGRAAPTMEYRIVDDDDRDVPPGEVGEIVYRGPTVMREYLGRPEATAEAFRGGWFHGGDLVREDDEGYLYVVDRKHDMIISGGENIYPAEVERVLVEHPAVADIAIVGIPHPDLGRDARRLRGDRAGRAARPRRARRVREREPGALQAAVARGLRRRASSQRERQDLETRPARAGDPRRRRTLMALGTLLTARDALFHQPAYRDPTWLETNWFSFLVPEANLRCHMYNGFRTNLGVVFSQIHVWSKDSPTLLDFDYWDSQVHLPLPPGNLDHYRLANGFEVQMNEPLRSWSVSYDGFGDTHFRLEYEALMPAVDSRETRLPTGADFSHFHAVDPALAATVGHIDQSLWCAARS